MYSGVSSEARLLLNGYDDIDSFVIKSLRRIVVPNLFDSVTNDLFVIDNSLSRNLTEDHNHASLSTRLTCNARVRVLRNTCVEHSIRYLVTKLVRVAFIHRLRSEKEGAIFC
ncbi:hypothetical protein Plhal304r1_c028g0092551 [Plasmopara halstedii]